MRIVAIRGSNLASLKGDFAVELDQPPLSNLGLFAIHGPVGAGKSTLLDTLTLALFGRTPRLSGNGGALVPRGDDDVDQLRANDPATLVRRSAASAHAEVDFIGHDGRLYRARWDIRRGRSVKGRPGRLQDEKQSLKDVVNDTVLGDGNSAVRRLIEERLGLSFDELCRSVLLAQGGFQGFLQAKPGERAELLEKVTGTGIYSRLGEAAFARAREVEQGLKALEARLDGLPVLDETARTTLEASVVVQGSAAANADASASALRHTLDRRRATRALHRAGVDVDAAVAVHDRAGADEREAHAHADAARGRLAALAPLLLEHERALAALATPRARLAEATRALADRAAAVARRARDHDDAVAAAAVTRARVAAAHDRLAGARTGVVGLLCAAVDEGTLEGHLHDAIRAVDDVADAAMALIGVGGIADAAAHDVELTAAARDAAITHRENAHAVAVAALPEGVAVADHAAATAAVAAQLVALATAEVATLDAGITVRTGVVARLEAALAEQAARQALKAARDALRDDEPCPVCGSCTHPARAHAVVAAAPQDPVDVVVRAERLALQQAHEARAATRALINAVVGRAATATSATPSSLEPPAHLDEARSRLAHLDAAAPAVFAVFDADAACANATAAEDAARAAHAMQVSQQDQARARLEAARAGLTAFGIVVDEHGSPETLRALATTLRRHRQSLTEATAAVADATADAQRLEHDVAAAREAVVAAEAEAAAARAIVVEREAAVADAGAAVTAAVAALADHGVDGDVAAFAGMLRDAVADTTRALQARATAARDADVALAAARRQYADRQEALERLGGALADSEPGDDDGALLARIDAVVAEGVAARDAAATARARLIHDDQIRAERARLAADLERSRAEGEVWRSLSSLIGSADGGRFRQFAQGLTLDALVTHANEHLAVLAPRYRLRRTKSEQQKHDLDLVIVDTEAGADVRSTQTLSGGESFLVSLALALGLSSLSANEGARGRVESLFIDEGFSALDQETLDVALSAFDALRQTGRQIGVISHVPLLMERLGAQVRVIPIGGGASRVEVHAS